MIEETSACRNTYIKVFLTFIILYMIGGSLSAQDVNRPNILLVIADDLGIDVSHGYQENDLMPTTPTLDRLRQSGITFKNVWAAPKCTPTRATIMSGKHGVKTGVTRSPGNLELEHTSIFKALEDGTNDAYDDAVIGKWHISSPVDFNHPNEHSIDHYEGVFSASVPNYYDWDKVMDGASTNITEYVTSHFTSSAIDWVTTRDQPWFLWLAHVAPHSPFHVPPEDLFTTPVVNTNQQKYIAAIEAMDAEIGRLLDNISEAELENTVIIYIGDNGTPSGVIQNFPGNHGKSTLYQGGVHVPMIISGRNVERQNEEDESLIQVTDLYATILEIAGIELPGGINNSLSFQHLLDCSEGPTRKYNYVDFETGWTIRDAQYKLINNNDDTQEFYDLSINELEDDNLISTLTPEQELIKNELEIEANKIRTDWSCQDLIQNGDENYIDDCDDVCLGDNSTSTTNIGCCDSPSEPNIYYEFVESDTRTVYTNNYPNHDFCYNPNLIPAPKLYLFNMDATPTVANSVTSVIADNGRPSRYFGVALNGVIMAPAPAQPFIFENPNTGEYNWDWVFEPTNNQGSGAGLVALDCASAHTGPQGYHYHGNMFEFAELLQMGVSTTNTPPTRPLQIGWASDGFPILYRFGPDGYGGLAELKPSYRLRTGLRPGDGVTEPCGAYNGKYTNDYQYICGQGDLDECNGVARQITLVNSNGAETFDYFYVITEDFPQVPRCLSGQPSLDFDNSNDGITGVDNDNDGYLDIVDCDDNNPDVHPNAPEVIGNGIDDNCDGEFDEIDNDNDGFNSNEDCNDNDASINPGAAEICDGMDNNCDGNSDEGLSMTTYYIDQDGDGYGDENDSLEDCMQPDGTVTISGDCNDLDANINPGQTEEPYNNVDDDCDPETLDDDLDQDGFVLAEDCDDQNENVNPDQVEIPYNGVDEDCNAATLDDDLDQDGFVLAEDCDDTDADINPDATEIPDNDIDENCDGMDLITSTNDPSTEDIKIYPNPVTEKLTIEIDNAHDYEIRIFAIDGREVHRSIGERTIRIAHLANGNYAVQIIDLSVNKTIIKIITIIN